MDFFLGIFPNYKPMGFYFGGLQNGKIRYLKMENLSEEMMIKTKSSICEEEKFTNKKDKHSDESQPPTSG